MTRNHQHIHQRTQLPDVLAHPLQIGRVHRHPVGRLQPRHSRRSRSRNLLLLVVPLGRVLQEPEPNALAHDDRGFMRFVDIGPGARMQNARRIQHPKALHDIRRPVRNVIRHPDHRDIPRLQRLHRLRTNMLPAALVRNIFIRTLRLHQQPLKISINHIRRAQRRPGMLQRRRRIRPLLRAHIAQQQQRYRIFAS